MKTQIAKVPDDSFDFSRDYSIIGVLKLLRKWQAVMLLSAIALATDKFSYTIFKS